MSGLLGRPISAPNLAPNRSGAVRPWNISDECFADCNDRQGLYLSSPIGQDCAVENRALIGTEVNIDFSTSCFRLASRSASCSRRSATSAPDAADPISVTCAPPDSSWFLATSSWICAVQEEYSHDGPIRRRKRR
eukprot:3863258-Pyramimonas_sp.AAC.1